MPIQRRTILFSGHVQGVGFRATTLQLAHDLDLRGSVRNTDDGDVEIVAEGPPEAFDTLISRLREHFRSFIRTIEQSTSPASGTLPPGLHVTF